MNKSGANYNSYIFFFSITILLYLSARGVHAETSPYIEYGPQEQRAYDPARFQYSQKTSSYLTKLKGQLTKKVFQNSGANRQAYLDMDYGQLFSPSNSGYLGYGYLSTKIDSENRVQFNTSLGHFIEAINGQLSFSYRLLGADKNYTFDTLGKVRDRLYENSFSAGYTRYSDTFLRETSLNYSFSTIPGKELATQFSKYHGTCQNTNTTTGGYGNVMRHSIDANVAFGYDSLSSQLLSGIKTSLGLGYEYATQDPFADYSTRVDEGVTLRAAIEQKSSIGLFNTSYTYLETSQTIHAGYTIKGVELYLRETLYHDKKDNKLLGFLLKFHLWKPKDPFRTTKKLFGRNNNSRKSLEQIRHSVSLSSGSFSIQPKAVEFIDS